MEIMIADAKFFKTCVDAIVNLVDEGVFEVNEQGLHLRSMDPSQIAMIDFMLPREAFGKLEVDGNQKIGINLSDLNKILARTRSDEKLTISMDEGENKLLLKFVGSSHRNFRLPLIELNSSSTPAREPKITFDAVLKMRGGSFKDMLRDAGLLSSHVIFQGEDSQFMVEAHGDSGDMNIESKKDSEHMAELKVISKARAMFPFEYLDDMTRACPDDAIIEVGLKTDAPVKLSYSINQAKLTYYLAPRVEAV